MKHPDKIYNVSQTQLSIARFYGGINYNGVYYEYDLKDDTLTRGDLVIEKSQIKVLKQTQTQHQDKLGF
jgi:hypothetical protein